MRMVVCPFTKLAEWVLRLKCCLRLRIHPDEIGRCFQSFS